MSANADASTNSVVRAATSLRDALTGPNTYGNGTAFWAVFVVAVGLLAIYPLTTNAYQVGLTSRYLALAFLALSLSFVWGYCGVLSFGQVAFFGVAAYAFGVVGINAGSTLGLTLAIPAAVLVGSLFALCLGYFMFYGGVRDVYVTIITLVVALVLNTFLDQTAGSEWTIGEAQLGGANGMPGIPELTVGAGNGALVLDGASLYYAVLATLLVTYLVLRVVVNSSFGMTMVAIREDEDRTQTFGYDVAFVKLVAFTIAGALAALGGVFYVGVRSFVNPDVFAITFAALPVVWVSIGGRESLLGAIGATLVVERMRNALATGVGGAGPEWALVIVGGSLLLVILGMPAGAAPYLDRVGRWIVQRSTERTRGDRTEETVE